MGHAVAIFVYFRYSGNMWVSCISHGLNDMLDTYPCMIIFDTASSCIHSKHIRVVRVVFCSSSGRNAAGLAGNSSKIGVLSSSARRATVRSMPPLIFLPVGAWFCVGTVILMLHLMSRFLWRVLCCVLSCLLFVEGASVYCSKSCYVSFSKG